VIFFIFLYATCIRLSDSEPEAQTTQFVGV